MRSLLGNLLLYGRRTPPPSISMCSGKVTIRLGLTKEESADAFRIADLLRKAMADSEKSLAA